MLISPYLMSKRLPSSKSKISSSTKWVLHTWYFVLFFDSLATTKLELLK